MVMSAMTPPLAATMVATRRSARPMVWTLTRLASAIFVSVAKPSRSRVRASSATRLRGVPGDNSQPRLGRMTSPETSTSIPRPIDNDTEAESVDPALPRLSDCMGRSLQATLPMASAPLAVHRSCHVSPRCRPSQSSTW